jgi:hypothetical protein
VRYAVRSTQHGSQPALNGHGNLDLAGVQRWHLAGHERVEPQPTARQQRDHGGRPEGVIRCAVSLLVPSRRPRFPPAPLHNGQPACCLYRGGKLRDHRRPTETVRSPNGSTVLAAIMMAPARPAVYSDADRRAATEGLCRNGQGALRKSLPAAKRSDSSSHSPHS